MPADASSSSTTGPTVAYSEEGGGVLATCKDCGWLTWTSTSQRTRAASKKHKCKKAS